MHTLLAIVVEMIFLIDVITFMAYKEPNSFPGMRKQLWSNDVMNLQKVDSHSLGMLLTYPSLQLFLFVMLFSICFSIYCNNHHITFSINYASASDMLSAYSLNKKWSYPL